VLIKLQNLNKIYKTSDKLIFPNILLWNITRIYQSHIYQ
jgi:hypothetical protein